jgi:hypothetical protein
MQAKVAQTEVQGAHSMTRIPQMLFSRQCSARAKIKLAEGRIVSAAEHRAKAHETTTCDRAACIQPPVPPAMGPSVEAIASRRQMLSMRVEQEPSFHAQWLSGATTADSLG